MEKFGKILLVSLVLGSPLVFAQEDKWVWEKIGDEVSSILPMGYGLIRSDLKWNSRVVKKGDGTWDDTNHHSQFWSISSHLSTFSPTYVAAAIIEAALIPMGWSFGKVEGSTEATLWITQDSSKKSYESENEELKKKIEESQRREAELKERLKEKVENFLESYDANTKLGILDPEVRAYLDKVRHGISAILAQWFHLQGTNLRDSFLAAQEINNHIEDADLAKGLLKRLSEVI